MTPPDDCLSGVPNSKWVYNFDEQIWQAKKFAVNICDLPERSGPLDCDVFYKTWTYDNR